MLIGIYNSIGELVLTHKPVAQEVSLYLKGKVNGIYVVVLKESGGRVSHVKLSGNK